MCVSPRSAEARRFGNLFPQRDGRVDGWGLRWIPILNLEHPPAGRVRVRRKISGPMQIQIQTQPHQKKEGRCCQNFEITCKAPPRRGKEKLDEKPWIKVEDRRYKGPYPTTVFLSFHLHSQQHWRLYLKLLPSPSPHPLSC